MKSVYVVASILFILVGAGKAVRFVEVHSRRRVAFQSANSAILDVELAAHSLIDKGQRIA
jgi:hypothetical protein